MWVSDVRFNDCNRYEVYAIAMNITRMKNKKSS